MSILATLLIVSLMAGMVGGFCAVLVWRIRRCERRHQMYSPVPVRVRRGWAA